MKLLLSLAIGLAAASAFAVDTPTAAPAPVARPDRMAAARQAIEAKDWARAVRELEAQVRDTPRNADAHNLLGYSYRNRADPDYAKAFSHYDMALKIDPRHKGAHEYAGEALLLQDKPAEAQVHLVALEQICGGRDCEEYRDLAKSIAAWKQKRGQ